MDDIFEAKVQEQVRRLQGTRLRAVEREVALKRIAWMRERLGRLRGPRPHSPAEAYELLLFAYLGLHPREAPIVREDPSGIEWTSLNACPTLEACQRLCLDTRHVCREAYERSTQAFISQINPQLRFYRSYSQIRPFASGCREGIFVLEFTAMLAAAHEAATAEEDRRSKARGAVLVLGSHVVGRARQASHSNDPTLHAEMAAIRQAAGTVGVRGLCGGVLFVTSRPCGACLSHAALSGLTTIVYDAPDETRLSTPTIDGSLLAVGALSSFEGWFEVLRAGT